MTHHEHPNVTVVREGFEALQQLRRLFPNGAPADATA